MIRYPIAVYRQHLGVTALSPSLLVRERGWVSPSGGAEGYRSWLRFSMICSVTRVVINTSYLPFSIDVLFRVPFVSFSCMQESFVHVFIWGISLSHTFSLTVVLADSESAQVGQTRIDSDSSSCMADSECSGDWPFWALRRTCRNGRGRSTG